jgi:Ca2+-binding EF-hand superfamily protein|eukprot:Stramenopile-MAST_4_protein_558
MAQKVPRSLADQFSEEDLREHIELFESFDTDGSGEIDAEELQQLCATMGNQMSLNEAETMIADIDIDGNGTVDISEFLTMMLDIKNSDATKEKGKQIQKLNFKKIAAQQAVMRREKKEMLIQQKEEAALKRYAATEEKSKEAQYRAYEMKIRKQQAKMQQNDIAFMYQQELLEKVELEKNVTIEQKARELQEKAKLAELRQAEIMKQQEKEVKLKSDAVERKLAAARENKERAADEAEHVRRMAGMKQERKRAINQRRAEIERLFAAKDLKLFREQFDLFDEDGSGSIDIHELGKILESLGETMTQSQLKALIAEIDTDGSGTIEWEEYLVAMHQKRQEARRKGKGLLEFFAVKLDQVKEKKESQLVEKEIAAQKRIAAFEAERQEVLKRAAEREAAEREAVIARNEEQQMKALKEKERIEHEINLELAEKASNISEKDKAAEIRLQEIERERLLEARQKSAETKASLIEKEKKRKALLETKDRELAAAEIEREKKRKANKRRADLERMFTPSDLRAFREQFDACDTDGSGSIDVAEMGAICRSLGEEMTDKQVRALIAEVDENGNGLVEWEEYLQAMYKKREGARNRGAGMLEFASKRAAEARKLKEQQAIEKELKALKRSEENDIVRKEAAAKAQKRIELEKIETAKRNKAIREKADIAKTEIETAKLVEEKQKAIAVEEKRLKALEIEKVVERQKHEQTKKAMKERLKKNKESSIKRERLAEEAEIEKARREASKSQKRQENAKRAELERMFNPRDMKHFKSQFHKYDPANTGSIDVAALGSIMSALGEDLNDAQLRSLVMQVDLDGSGSIEWNEYLLLMHAKREEARAKGMGLLEYASVRKREAEAIRKKNAEEQRNQAAKKVEATEIEIAKANERQLKKIEREKEEKIRANIAARKKADKLQKAEKEKIEKMEKEKANKLKGKDAEAEKRAAKQKKMVLQKAAEKEKALKAKQKIAEERRILKAKFEEQRRLLKEKIVNVKAQGKKSAVRLLQEKFKEIDEAERVAFEAMMASNSTAPQRPDIAQAPVANPSPRAKRIQ